MSVRAKSRASVCIRLLVAVAACLMAALVGCTSGGDNGQLCSTDLQNDNLNCGSCGHACPSGWACQSGTCSVVCVGGTTGCGDTCANLNDDPKNCGACGTKCPGDQLCNGKGQCAEECFGGTKACDQSCKDLQNDSSNCGSCNNVCAAGYQCVSGKCASKCPPGYTSCSAPNVGGGDGGKSDASSDATVDSGSKDGGGSAGYVCVNTSIDATNCGKCGKVCPAGNACQNGKCVLSCAAPEINCGGQCINPATDNNNCGGCNKPCSSGNLCSGGQCGVTCQSGYNTCTDCATIDAGVPEGGDAASDGAADASVIDAGCQTVCSDPQTDTNNCGACNQPCQQGYQCVAGNCQIVCPSGYGVCGVQCFDFMNDNLHCGDCFTQCWGSQSCTQGICCDPGLVNCAGQCTDTTSDAKNCGACGKTCSGGTPYCVNSACQQCPTGATIVNGKCQIVFSIDASLLDNTPYSCGTYKYNCGGTWGFHWQDTAAGATVSSVQIQIEGGLECSAGTRTMQLNGTAVGTFNTTYNCSCAAPPALWSANANPLSSYVTGAKNAISISIPSCEGAEPNSNWSGAYAQVTVRY